MRKIKVLLLFSSFFLLLSSVSAFAEFSVKMDGDDAILNTTIGLESQREVNYFRLSWQIPDNSKIISVRDTIGKIDTYEVSDGKISLKTNLGDRRKKETIFLRLRVEGVVDDTYAPLKTAYLSLPGFEGDEALASIKAEGLISGSHSPGFNASFLGDTMRLKGKGPLNFRVAFSEKGEKYEHFVIFDDYNLSMADEFYDYIVGVTGTKPLFERFPVIVLPDPEYEKRLNKWSSGQYRSGGLIFVKKSVMESNKNVSIVIHEATHGFNQQVLRWDRTSSRWFDEGVAKYMEYLVNRKFGLPQAEIFGERVYFSEDGEEYYLEPRKNPEDLLNYYKEGKDYMYEWSRQESVREFGYAFSELFIRNYLRKNGYGALHDVYRSLKAINRKVSDLEEKRDVILDAMDTDLKPCYSKELDEIKSCLKEVHEQNPKVPVVNLKIEKQNLSFNFTSFEEKSGGNGKESDSELGEGLKSFIELNKAKEDSGGLTGVLNGFINFMVEKILSFLSLLEKF